MQPQIQALETLLRRAILRLIKWSRQDSLVLLWSGCAAVALIHNGWPHHARRLSDFAKIKTALEQYRLMHSTYPKVDGAVTAIGTDGRLATDWIPGLVPEFLRSVPFDPRRSSRPNLQYLYFSDGIDYKLIAHGAEDVQSVLRSEPSLTDPVRVGTAYGIWTPNAERW